MAQSPFIHKAGIQRGPALQSVLENFLSVCESAINSANALLNFPQPHSHEKEITKIFLIRDKKETLCGCVAVWLGEIQ